MSSKAYDISLIRKYLRGELDTRVMYRMERTSQDDPFLMEALEGYYVLSDQQANLEELAGKLHNRVQRSKKKMFLLSPLISAIIAVLAFAILGVWWFAIYLPQTKKEHQVTHPIEKAAVVEPAPIHPDPQSLAIASATALDTTRKDTTAKPLKRDPTHGSVEASTVIADLNKAPYSTAKPKSAKPQSTAGTAKQSQDNATSGSVLNSTSVTQRPSTVTGKPVNNGKATAASGTNITATPTTKLLADKTVSSGSVKGPVVSNQNIKNNAATINNTLNSKTLTTNSAPVPPVKKDIVTIRETGKPLATNSSPGATFQAARINPGPTIKLTDITTVSGVVVSADNGKPIAGVALRIMGTQQGTITDAGGRFNIRMARNQVLQANFIGYYGQQVPATGNDLKVLLQPIGYDQRIERSDKPQNDADKKNSTNPTDKSETNPPAENKGADIIVEKKNPDGNTQNAKINSQLADAQPKDPVIRVSGRVVAQFTNYPLPRVVMWNKNEDVQYRLLNDGLFDIAARKGDEIYVGRSGYKTHKIKIKNSNQITVALEETTSPLYDGFLRGITFEQFDDATHPKMGWDKFKDHQTIKSTDGKKGTVKIDFTVNSDDTVNNIKVAKSVSAPADSQAISILKDQTKWVHNTNNKPEKLSVKFKVE